MGANIDKDWAVKHNNMALRLAGGQQLASCASAADGAAYYVAAGHHR